MLTKKIFKILGMDCASCVINIDGALEDTKGIKEARTNYAKQQTEVMFDSDHVSEKDIIGIIKQAGYDTLPTSSKKTF